MIRNLYLLAKLRVRLKLALLPLRLFFLRERIIHRLAMFTATIRNR